jgi:protein MPE1
MSTIFFKFPHQSTESRLTFDGTHISVFDVKKEVMLQTKLGSGRDFDLSVTDASSKEGQSCIELWLRGLPFHHLC